MINIIYHSKEASEEDNYYMPLQYATDEDGANQEFDDYTLYLNKIGLKEGRLPENPYETIVNIDNKDQIKLWQECNKKINGRKLLVVGYYTTMENINTYLISKETLLTKLVLTSKDISVYPKEKEKSLELAREKYDINIKDSYTSSKEKYKKEQRDSIKSSLISAGIILAISLIEILLMIRSSFLSRIKEVGIYRAIGVKKKDIYIMFSGEIIAITIMASIPASKKYLLTLSFS